MTSTQNGGETETILVTGGVGYIGSHTVFCLIDDGYNVVVVDNLSNGHAESVKRVEKMTGKSVPFYDVDLLDKKGLTEVFDMHKDISKVIHFAALKAVGESVANPLRYYKINIMGTINLIEVMSEHDVKSIMFSSSGTVYGDPEYFPMDEKHPVGKCTNPYAKTKFCVEEIFRDLCIVKEDWSVTALRYFNPVGAHPSGMIGEDPRGVPHNLTPFISQVALGKRPELLVFGGDYDTHDGTGVRDYIHVMDLAKGHIAALKKASFRKGFDVYNLGTGKGNSVLDVIKAFESVTGIKIAYRIVDRRPGDVATMRCDPQKAGRELNWKAEHSMEQMCKDLWNWQTLNPNGYAQKTETQ